MPLMVKVIETKLAIDIKNVEGELIKLQISLKSHNQRVEKLKTAIDLTKNEIEVIESNNEEFKVIEIINGEFEIIKKINKNKEIKVIEPNKKVNNKLFSRFLNFFRKRGNKNDRIPTDRYLNFPEFTITSGVLPYQKFDEDFAGEERKPRILFSGYRINKH
jgi:hypothetical protein